MSAADIIAALQLAREVETANAAVRLHPGAVQPAAVPATAMPEENVMPLATVRAAKKEEMR
jgi:hypothetical protein